LMKNLPVEYFDHVPYFIHEQEPTLTLEKDLLTRILKREDEIRKSEEIQERYTHMKLNWGPNEEYEGFAIDRSCQIQALSHFGFNPEKDESHFAYQIACGKWIEDLDVKNSVVWMKYDKMRFGTLDIGSKAPNAQLVSLNGQHLQLYDFLNEHTPLVLVGGSYS